jgi:hypothetical protein
LIDRIAEVNRVLLAVSDLIGSGSRADARAVIRLCEGTVIGGRMPNHEASIEFAVQIGLLAVDGRYLLLTKEGGAFLEMNPQRLYDLSDDQKRFLIRARYLDRPFREGCLAVLSSFSPSYAHDTYRWSSIDSPPINGGEIILEQLRELGLLVRGETWYEVSAEFVGTVATFLAEGKGFTEEQFLEYLREKQEVGEIAEELVLESEAERLRGAGHKAEEMSIRRISKLKVNAGYDIESFDGKSKGVKYDRFIEVKGSKGSKVRFLWTDNEMKVARQLRERYWIYFQGGIDLSTKKAKNELLVFQNPIEAILNDANFTKTPQGIVVEANLRGKILTIA